jgi:hypothetical protein
MNRIDMKILRVTNLISLLKYHKENCQDSDCGVNVFIGKELARDLINDLDCSDSRKAELYNSVAEIKL